MRRIYLRAWVIGAIIAAASLHSNAAGLGRMDVKSVLGEPLRTEITVLANPGELSSLKVQLASPQAYDAAGLVYTPLNSQLVVTLHLDEGEIPFVSITSAQPINDPVLDLLLELTWASGRVTREYTAFIDPPALGGERDQQRADDAVEVTRATELTSPGAETQAATAPSLPTAEPLPADPFAASAAKQADAESVETFGGTAPTLFGTAPTMPSSAGAQTSAAESVAQDASVTISEQPIKVVRGDTLSKIALANKPAGVTLNQMLVVLYRNNREAFSGSNMNRLRTGKIIRLADPEEYRRIDVASANREVRVQTTSWKAYKQQLAAATVRRQEQLPQQTAGGAVTPRIEEPVPLPSAGTSPEVVKLSRGDPATAGQGAGEGASAALQEKLVATEKALEESNDRVTRLEKIIEDLQKLAEVQNQDMADLQSQAGTAAAPKPSPTPAVPQAATPQPVLPPPPAAPDQTAPDIQPAPDSAAPAQPGQQAPTTGQSATTTPAPAPPAAAGRPPNTTAPARKPRSRPPPAPPSLIDRALAQPYLLAIPVVLIVIIGWGAWRLRGRFGAWRGGSNRSAPSAVGSVAGSHSGTFSPDATDVGLAGRGGDSGEEVDPLEEAEIFLAYGRDAQAEELLQEAIAAHPTRFDIHLKLLEIYAKQSNKEAFEKLARSIQQAAGGDSEVWEHVARLGYSIDPDNPRYADGAGHQNEKPAYDQFATDMSSPAEHLDFDVGKSTDLGAESRAGADIDLGASDNFAKTQVMSGSTTDTGGASAAMESDINLDLDLPSLDQGASALDLPVDDGGNTVDFDFDSSKIDNSAADSGTLDETATTSFDPGLEFNLDDFSFGDDDETQADVPETESSESSDSSEAPALDLSGISLDLDETATSQSDTSGKDDKWYEVQTKFDLAKAYQEMGDNDGAREILKEVISEGDSDQKAAAESVLSSLA